MNPSDISLRKAARGRAIVHSDERYRNSNDSLGDVLLDLLHFAYRDGKYFKAELDFATKAFKEDIEEMGKRSKQKEELARFLEKLMGQKMKISELRNTLESAVNLTLLNPPRVNLTNGDEDDSLIVVGRYYVGPTQVEIPSIKGSTLVPGWAISTADVYLTPDGLDDVDVVEVESSRYPNEIIKRAVALLAGDNAEAAMESRLEEGVL